MLQPNSRISFELTERIRVVTSDVVFCTSVIQLPLICNTFYSLKWQQNVCFDLFVHPLVCLSRVFADTLESCRQGVTSSCSLTAMAIMLPWSAM